MKYQVVVRLGRKAAYAVSKDQWTLGDLALTVETVYGEGNLQEYADDIDVEYKALLNFRWVASRYDIPERSGNSWTVHQVFASQEDRAELVQQKEWTVSEARELIRNRRGASPRRPRPDLRRQGRAA